MRYKRPAAAEEKPQQNRGAGADDHKLGDAEQQLAGLVDFGVGWLRNRDQLFLEVYRLEQLVALVGNGVAAHQHHERSAAADFERGLVGVGERLGKGGLRLRCRP